MNRFVSQKFRFYSFVCIALLMLVHGYNLDEAYLQPFTMVKEPLTVTTFTEYFLANGALRFRIPLLFIISGYIFAYQDHKPYNERVKSRFKSLMVPYFIWSAVGLGLTFLLQHFTYTAHLVKEAGIDQLGDNRPYSAIGFKGIFYRWAVVPISFQLWFIRSLFIYNLLYPFFKWAVTKFPVPWFVLMFVLWFAGFQYVFIEAQGILFFTVGIWLSKTNYPIEKKPGWYSHYLGWLFFLGVSVIRTFMAFELELYTRWSIAILLSLHVISVVAGIFAMWYGADSVVRWCMKQRWFAWTSSFAFVIYGLHVPLIIYLTTFLFDVWKSFPYHRLLIYFLAPVIVLGICVAFGALLRAVAPRVYRLFTGGRGF
ncbi:MAG: acyltransferase [Bacteroidota bacterium]